MSIRHLDPKYVNAIHMSIPEPLVIPDSATNPAKWTYTRLGGYIRDFEAELDAEHEIGASLVCFGRDITFRIESVGYHGPDIIDFSGVDNEGRRVRLIQNVSQLSVLLVALKRRASEPARRIGFIWDEAHSVSADGT